MKAKLASLTIGGLLFLGGASGAALAGGDFGGGDYIGIPVPAPVPIPLHEPIWYFRADIGIGFASSDASVSGAPLGTPNLSSGALTPFGYSDDWFNTDFDVFHTLGLGVGRRFGSHWRGDLTFDYQSLGDGTIGGATNIYAVFDNSVAPPVATGTFAYETVRESFKVTNNVFMVNGYYDFAPVSAFTPYVGAGLGFSVNRIRRTMSSTLFNCAALDPTCSAPASGGTISGEANEQNVSLATAVTAGFSYDIGDITTLDFNYRFLYIDSFGISMPFEGTPTKLEFDGVFEHQLRAGLRFNVF